MYGKRHQTHVNLDRLPDHLCGLSRAGHFGGVATVVCKLFNIVRPHVAFFGNKDYQQLVVIKQLVLDLNFDIKIVGVPTVREPDGLAMSSRNTYLSEDERASALSLFGALEDTQDRVAQGDTGAQELIREAEAFIASHAHTKIDYVAICDPETLEDVDKIEGPSLMALAVWVGKTRLIDNAIVKP
jgi:pantoate--beta-alanine ligase